MSQSSWGHVACEIPDAFLWIGRLVWWMKRFFSGKKQNFSCRDDKIADRKVHKPEWFSEATLRKSDVAYAEDEI